MPGTIGTVMPDNHILAAIVALKQRESGHDVVFVSAHTGEVIAELACALRVGERTIASWLGDGDALVRTYPATLEALREGRIAEGILLTINAIATALRNSG